MTAQEVNPAVNMILPGAFFERTGSGQLYLMNPQCKYYPKLRWRLRDDKLWPYDRTSATFTGGTVVMALTQLSLWLLDRPRRPLHCFRRWAEYGLGDEQGFKLLDYLTASSYPLRTQCVFCGNEEASDWWSIKGEQTGPCCRGGECRKVSDGY